jgi:hypothetical protein
MSYLAMDLLISNSRNFVMCVLILTPLNKTWNTIKRMTSLIINTEQQQWLLVTKYPRIKFPSVYHIVNFARPPYIVIHLGDDNLSTRLVYGSLPARVNGRVRYFIYWSSWTWGVTGIYWRPSSVGNLPPEYPSLRIVFTLSVYPVNGDERRLMIAVKKLLERRVRCYNYISLLSSMACFF